MARCLIVGAPSNDAGGVDAGAAYVIYGQDTAMRGDVNVGAFHADHYDGSNGYRIIGAQEGGNLGHSVAGRKHRINPT